MAKNTAAPSGSGKGLSVMSFEELAADVKTGVSASLYLIWGEEEYLIERSLQSMRNALITAGCQDADSYTTDWSSSAGDVEELREMVLTPPFLSRKRMITIKNSGLFAARSPESPESARKYVDLFSSVPDFCCLIFVEEKIDKRKKILLDAVQMNGRLVQMEHQSSDTLCKWVARTLGKDGILITTEAINSLVDRSEASMLTLGNEMKKIILYCRNAVVTEISLKEIDSICIPDIRGSIFQMTDAIGARNIGRALTVLDTLISLKEPVPKIRFMLARHLRQLICAKELVQADRIMTALKVVPFVARNLAAQAKSFQMDELTALYEACATSDFSVKTGKMEDRLSMETLLVSAGKSSGKSYGFI